MKLKCHGRYDYSAITARKDYSWPGGKRLAVHLCLNVEHCTVLGSSAGDRK